MYRRFHQRFGTAGLLVAITALVLAIGGTALAASGALTGKQKKEVEKIAKKYAGQPGAPGPAGPAGSNGTPGKDGTNGTNGSNGATGAAGTSATTVSFSGNAHGCTEGGIEVKSASAATFVCNGPEGEVGEDGAPGVPGAQGPQGEPWAPNSSLPPGAIETGSWAFSASSETNPAIVPISFPVSFPFNLAAAHVHFQTEANFEDFDESGPSEVGCLGSLLNPGGTASGATTPNPPGELCVYTEGLENSEFKGIFKLSPEFKGATKAGATMDFEVSETGTGLDHSRGSWAVTGCTKGAPPVECPAGS